MRIAIAGFGMGGATAAVTLARDGHDVTVFERAAEPGPAGAGFLLQPSGQAVLAALDLLDDVRSGAWPIRAFHAEHARGRTLSLLRYDRRDSSAHALGVARGRLFSTLERAAIAAGVQIRPGVRVVTAHEAQRTVVPVDAAGAELGSFDLLVAADGMRSVLRRRVDPGARLFVSPFAALWGLGKNDGPCPDRLVQQTRGVGVLAGLLPVGEREMAVFWGLRAADLDATVAAGWPAFVERATAVFPATAYVLDDINGFDRLAVARYGFVELQRRHTARIVLIGDAAHPSPPHLGQGANLALLDAAALAAALREERDVGSAVVAWDRRRAFQNLRYTLMSRALSPFFQSSHTWLGPLRDVSLPVMGALPPARWLMEHVLAGRG